MHKKTQIKKNVHHFEIEFNFTLLQNKYNSLKTKLQMYFLMLVQEA